jgi:hypothetical protein
MSKSCFEPLSAERCVQEAERLRSEAFRPDPSSGSNARPTYTAAHLNEWLASGLSR